MRIERERRAPNEESPKGEHWRQRVEYDDQYGLTLVADERLTSPSKNAQVTDATTIELTDPAVRWLHATLGELVAAWDDRDKARPVENVAPSQPKNDVDYVQALVLVARDARSLIEERDREGATLEDVAAALPSLEESLARLHKIESRIVPIASAKRARKIPVVG